jgi:hypothetical protein
MKLVKLTKMCLAETDSGFRVGKHLPDMFPIRNGLKQGDALSPLLFNFALEYEDASKLHITHEFWLLLIMFSYWSEAYIL